MTFELLIVSLDCPLNQFPKKVEKLDLVAMDPTKCFPAFFSSLMGLKLQPKSSADSDFD